MPSHLRTFQLCLLTIKSLLSSLSLCVLKYLIMPLVKRKREDKQETTWQLCLLVRPQSWLLADSIQVHTCRNISSKKYVSFLDILCDSNMSNFSINCLRQTRKFNFTASVRWDSRCCKKFDKTSLWDDQSCLGSDFIYNTINTIITCELSLHQHFSYSRNILRC